MVSLRIRINGLPPIGVFRVGLEMRVENSIEGRQE